MTRKIIRYIAVLFISSGALGRCLPRRDLVRASSRLQLRERQRDQFAQRLVRLHTYQLGVKSTPETLCTWPGPLTRFSTVPKSGSSGRLITVRGDLANNPGIIDVSTGDAVNISGQTYVALDGITINRSGLNKRYYDAGYKLLPGAQLQYLPGGTVRRYLVWNRRPGLRAGHLYLQLQTYQ